eukprot:5055827-Amphidinium_carterae.1
MRLSLCPLLQLGRQESSACGDSEITMSAVWRCSRLHRHLDEAFGRELAVRVTEELGPFKADLPSDAESSSDDDECR